MSNPHTHRPRPAMPSFFPKPTQERDPVTGLTPEAAEALRQVYLLIGAWYWDVQATAARIKAEAAAAADASGKAGKPAKSTAEAQSAPGDTPEPTRE
ncbi:MAG: hypothetical protein IPK16_12380 [Anaerolineales bacterium]|nr:hypothetical protein [Anaerolineales bacterium]